MARKLRDGHDLINRDGRREITPAVPDETLRKYACDAIWTLICFFAHMLPGHVGLAVLQEIGEGIEEMLKKVDEPNG